MENLKRPAHAQPIAFCEGNTTAETAWGVHEDFAGFTKLELASLMAMQGMLSNSLPLDQGYEPLHHLTPEEMAPRAVEYAKAVLEEANK